jgi:hypothetical protein
VNDSASTAFLWCVRSKQQRRIVKPWIVHRWLIGSRFLAGFVWRASPQGPSTTDDAKESECPTQRTTGLASTQPKRGLKFNGIDELQQASN